VLLTLDLGLMPYASALVLQRTAARARASGELANDLLILVEHPPVITLGRNTKRQHLSASPELLAAQGVELHEVERGGDVTFHGPGQLVGYPILDLRGLKQDLHWYLRQLEEVLIQVINHWGLTGLRNPGQTGVWVPGSALTAPPPASGPGGHPEPGTRQLAGPAGPPPLRKIASIGVHAREWVTWHGFALNVETDLRYFDLMVPCGIPGVRMTSMTTEAGASVSMADVKNATISAMRDVFGYVSVQGTTLDEITAPTASLR
jgi:lipoyl(octanoyl) transferase